MFFEFVQFSVINFKIDGVDKLVGETNVSSFDINGYSQQLIKRRDTTLLLLFHFLFHIENFL